MWIKKNCLRHFHHYIIIHHELLEGGKLFCESLASLSSSSEELSVSSSSESPASNERPLTS